MTDNILDLANSAVGGKRGDHYGHQLDDFTRSAQMISGLLGHPVKPSDIPLIMICIKLSRQKNQYKADNLVDIAGCALTAEMVHKEAMKRDANTSTFAPLGNNSDLGIIHPPLYPDTKELTEECLNLVNRAVTNNVPYIQDKVEIGWYVAMDKDEYWFKYESKPKKWVGSWDCLPDLQRGLSSGIKPWHDWIDSLFQMTETGLVKV